MLGVAIIAGAAFVKVPQILALSASRSAVGLSALSFELENIGYTIHASYGFLLGLPFSAYGEAGIMLLQNTLLLGLVYRYAKVSATRALSVAVANVAIIAAVVTGAQTPNPKVYTLLVRRTSSVAGLQATCESATHSWAICESVSVDFSHYLVEIVDGLFKNV